VERAAAERVGLGGAALAGEARGGGGPGLGEDLAKGFEDAALDHVALRVEHERGRADVALDEPALDDPARRRRRPPRGLPGHERHGEREAHSDGQHRRPGNALRWIAQEDRWPPDTAKRVLARLDGLGPVDRRGDLPVVPAV
jgi:hypothetical protein